MNQPLNKTTKFLEGIGYLKRNRLGYLRNRKGRLLATTQNVRKANPKYRAPYEKRQQFTAKVNNKNFSPALTPAFQEESLVSKAEENSIENLKPAPMPQNLLQLQENNVLPPTRRTSTTSIASNPSGAGRKRRTTQRKLRSRSK